MNIFKNIILKIIGEKKCQNKITDSTELHKVSFSGSHYYINGKPYDINNISVIYYGVGISNKEEIKYYIVLNLKTKIDDTLPYKGLKLVNTDTFINSIEKFNVLAIPTVSNLGVYTIAKVVLTIAYTCAIYEKYLVSIYHSTLRRKNFSINNISLEELLENPKKYISSIVKEDKGFNIKLLSKKLTLHRGYGLYPILNNEIIIEDIFYSFNENEIKTKIIELFDKYIEKQRNLSVR